MPSKFHDQELVQLEQDKEALEQLKNLIQNEYKFALPASIVLRYLGFFGLDNLAPVLFILAVGPSCKQAYVYNQKVEALEEYFSKSVNTSAINEYLYSHLSSYSDQFFSKLKHLAKDYLNSDVIGDSQFQDELSKFIYVLKEHDLLLKVYYMARNNRTPDDIVSLIKENDAVMKQLDKKEDDTHLLQLAEGLTSHIHTKHANVVADEQHYPELKLYFDLFALMELNDDMLFKAVRFVSDLPEKLPMISQVNLVQTVRDRFFKAAADGTITVRPEEMWERVTHSPNA